MAVPIPEAWVEVVRVEALEHFGLGWQDKVLDVDYRDVGEKGVVWLTILRRPQ